MAFELGFAPVSEPESADQPVRSPVSKELFVMRKVRSKVVPWVGYAWCTNVLSAV